ncbi:MAG: hypothetical protein KTR14_02765 [Vampirovibrio sp.]|nr:hypothetical protein [Vampirovibrio sp.]
MALDYKQWLGVPIQPSLSQGENIVASSQNANSAWQMPAPVDDFTSRHSIGTKGFGETAPPALHKGWIAPETYVRLLRASDNIYTGHIPSELLDIYKGNPKQLLQTFDEITQFARRVEKRGETERQSTYLLEIEGFDSTATLKRVDNGEFGVVYHVKMNGEDYALKVFHSDLPPESIQKAIEGTHGAFKETATDLSLYKNRYDDYRHFYLGNPHQGWVLGEFIDDTLTRPPYGRRLHEDGVINLDVSEVKSGSDKNKIGPAEISIDPGGFGRQADFIEVDTLLESNHLFERRYGAFKLQFVPGNNKRILILKALESDDPGVLAFLPSQLQFLPKSIQVEKFDQLLATGHSDILTSLAQNIDTLLQGDGLSNPNKTKRFDALLKSGQPRILAGLAQHVSHLPKGDQASRFHQLLASGHPEVLQHLYKSSFKIDSFTKSDTLDVIDKLISTKHPAVLGSIAKNIDEFIFFPESEIIKRVPALVQSDLNTAMAFAKELGKLTSRKKAAHIAYDHLLSRQDPEVIPFLVKNVGVLDDNRKREVIEQLILYELAADDQLLLAASHPDQDFQISTLEDYVEAKRRETSLEGFLEQANFIQGIEKVAL